MNDCQSCIHKSVCDQCRGTGCLFMEDCNLYESVKPLPTNERAELQMYRNTELAPWQVRAMKDTVSLQKDTIERFQKDRVRSDVACEDAIAYLNDEVFPQVSYDVYCWMFDRITAITDWMGEQYGWSNKEYMRKGEKHGDET